MIKTRWATLVLVVSFLILSACTTSVVKPDNPHFAFKHAKEYALVYLIRPAPIRTRGVADYDIKVEFGEGHLVAELSSGEYVAFKVRPGNVDIITRSYAYVTARTLPEKVWRARNFTFEAGKTYYIHTRFTQEEFRGMYYIPVEISKQEALNMLKRLKPAGELAIKNPIE